MGWIARHFRRSVPPEKVAAARRQLRAALTSFLRIPGLRQKLRRRMWLGWCLLGVEALAALVIGRVATYQLLPHWGTKLPPFHWFLPERTRELLRLIVEGDFPANTAPADAFEAFARAEILESWLGANAAQKNAPEWKDAVTDLSAALDAGTRFEPENLWWPYLRACGAAERGPPEEALATLVRECERGQRIFRVPLPQGPYRDLLLEALGPRIYYAEAEGTSSLFASASRLADEGNPAPAHTLGRIADAALEEFGEQQGGGITRNTVYWYTRALASGLAKLVDRSPGCVEPSRRELALARDGALRALFEGGAREALFFISGVDSILLVVMCVIIFYTLVRDLLATFIGQWYQLVLSRGRTCLREIYLQPLATGFALRVVVFVASVIFALRASMFMCAIWIVIGLLALASTYRLMRPFRGDTKCARLAGKGPWSAKLIRALHPAQQASLGLVMAGVFLGYSLDAERVPSKQVGRLFLSPATYDREMRAERWAAFDASFGRLCALLPSARDAAEIRAAAKDAGLVLSEGVSEDERARFRRAASWRSAPVDPVTGGVIAFWVKRKTGDEPIYLDEMWGMAIVWNDREQRFYLYDCGDERCFASTNFADFVKEVDALPRRITIEEPQTCTAPLSWNMPPGEREKLMRAVERGRRTVVPGEFTICTCESGGLRFPDGALVKD